MAMSHISTLKNTPPMRLLLLLLFFAPLTLPAQTTVAVVTDTASVPAMRAAAALQRYLGDMTGRHIDVLPFGDIPPKTAAVFIGYHPSLEQLGFGQPPDMADDAYFLQGLNGHFLIAGNAEYGAYDLLERLGCRKYSPRFAYIPKKWDLRFPELPPTLESPAFPYRELWYEPAFDEEWARWHRLKTNPQKNAEWGLFVHTFHKLCPEERYFQEHPEYFSWNGAQYSPGQLCLSNDTVRQIVTASLREMIREKPSAIYWSVSQNDNFDYCKCARCAASDARYGGPAGTLLAFVNAVAAEFPDKVISTLAYQYTRRAPVGIRPAPNVSVCLCSIECNRGLPIEEGCTDFARDLREWPALTENLMIWDYVVQFRSYISPFPNWHTLQPNLQLFRDHGVRMVFEQGSGHDRSEFSDMRAYLLAKLMWNPGLSPDSIMHDFARGYYGPSSSYILDYIRLLSANLAASDRWLGIYGTPQMAAHSFLTEENLLAYQDLFYGAMLLQEDIEDSVEDPRVKVYGPHLTEAVLPLWYAWLEQMKIWDSIQLVAEELLPNFISGLKATGHLHLHERGYTADQYEADYRKFLQEGRVVHLFSKKNTETHFEFPPSPKYEKGRPGVLTDTKRGTDDYNYNWLGFEGTDMVATLTLDENGELPPARSVSVQFLQDQQSWVFFPEEVTIEISEDGQEFRPVHTEKIAIAPDGGKTIRRVEAVFEPAAVRAVRVRAVNQKVCPPWHPCVGNPCWIFADEVVVR
jgi:hypothetical protein